MLKPLSSVIINSLNNSVASVIASNLSNQKTAQIFDCKNVQRHFLKD
ncbi:hypothetical protein HMPREF1410_01026 [Helicobacter pylori GAM249T]|nr:hypothetical protein HMPREF1410_01026 [Helicobacter pylori GAM249T]